MTMSKQIRRLVLALLVGIPLLPAAATANEPQPFSFRLDWLPAGYQAPYYLAQKKGWFEKAGLKVTMEDGNGSATSVQLAAAGKYDVAAAALSNMAIARAKGVPVISIAGFFRKGNIVLIVPEDSPIKGPQDLKGKKLVYTAAAQEGPYIDSFLAQGGLKRDQMALVNVDATAKFTMYLNGDVDGVFTNATALARVNARRPSRTILFADFNFNVPDFGLVTAERTLKAKGPALGKLASVVSGSWMYILNGHQQEGIEAIIAERPNDKLRPAELAEQLRLSIPFLFTKATENLPVGVQSDVDWKNAIESLERANLIGPGTKPSDYFTNDYLDLQLIKKVAAGG